MRGEITTSEHARRLMDEEGIQVIRLLLDVNVLLARLDDAIFTIRKLLCFLASPNLK